MSQGLNLPPLLPQGIRLLSPLEVQELLLFEKLPTDPLEVEVLALHSPLVPNNGILVPLHRPDSPGLQRRRWPLQGESYGQRSHPLRAH